MDVLWIDAERGCSLLAREWRSSESGLPSQEFSAGAHREIAPGIWFPGWFENIQYEAAGPDAADRKPIVMARATVDAVQVNEGVSESLFDFEPPNGALWFDREGGGCEQRKPGGLDYLDQLIEANRPPLPRSDLRANVSFWPTLLVSGLATATLIACGRKVRRATRSARRMR